MHFEQNCVTTFFCTVTFKLSYHKIMVANDLNLSLKIPKGNKEIFSIYCIDKRSTVSNRCNLPYRKIIPDSETPEEYILIS